MKNKKLFAILTLVCFMFTLMPVAAFAADALSITINSDGSYTVKSTEAGTIKVCKPGTGAEATWSDPVKANGTKTGTAASLAEYAAGAGYVALYDADGNLVDKEVITAEMQALSVAKTNPSADPGESVIATVKSDVKVDTDEFVDVVIDLNETLASGENLIVWAEKTNDVATKSLVVIGGNELNNSGIYQITPAGKYVELKVAFTTAGEYTLHAAIVANVQNIDIDSIDSELVTEAGYKTITVEGANLDTSLFEMIVDSDDINNEKVYDEKTSTGVIKVDANGVDEDEVVLTFNDEKNGEPVVGYTVTVETNSTAIEVSKNTLTTNYKGQVKFDVSGTIEGSYLIDVVCEDFNAEIKVQVGSTAAAYIALEKQPATPQALYGALQNDKVTFAITDINGNVVDEFADGGMDGIKANANGKYIVLTEAPEASDLESDDLGLKYLGDGTWGITGIDKDAEGTYSVKVILDNGARATATWEVKKFATPVKIIFDELPSTVELGSEFMPALVYMDANNVAKSATDAELAVTGYAVAGLANDNTVTVKTDEKYAGSVITLTAVSEKYDLVATANVTVAAEAVGIAFEDDTLEANVNNKVDWNVVDAEGNKVTLTNKYSSLAGKGATAYVNYVVLDKPEGAKVSVTGTKQINNFKGEGEMSLTSNKVGNVTVQVVAKVELVVAGGNDLTAKQTKYYTGTEIFAVGTSDKGDVVVMSIGSNEIVINDAKAAIDAAPIVENNRTFVPFRALAEAFGATVAYDEATQAVTAELNGVTVVMTIGSAEYTVNGEAKTADVAPFINGSRTMVPVRFAAEAFGIKVIPTYDENGATADILFNL